MQDCFRKHPEIYGGEVDEEGPTVEDASSTAPVTQASTSGIVPEETTEASAA